MTKIEDAIERIKILECPTGKVENRISGILEDYGVATRSEVEVTKSNRLDTNGAAQFYVNITGDNNESLIVLATSGMDDYVAKVTDAYIR